MKKTRIQKGLDRLTNAEIANCKRIMKETIVDLIRLKIKL